MIMRRFNQRVINKGVIMQYTTYKSRVVEEHKRNMNILDGILLIVDINNIKYHMLKLNRYNKHIPYKLFINLYVVKCYRLKPIQLRVLYNSLLFNSHIK